MGDRIAVVGGGITGLSLAYRLIKHGHRVTVYDGAPSLGGLSVSADFGDFTWDRYYHVIAGSDQTLLDLIDEIGLGDEVRWQTTRQGIFIDGKVRSLVGPMDLLRLPGLSIVDKFRLGLLALRGHRPCSDRELDSTTSADWVRKRCGERAYQRFWAPLLRSKLGDAATTTAARFIHATLTRLHSARGSSNKEQFGYVVGGYRRILSTLEQQLLEHGAELRANSPVKSVRADDRGTIVETGVTSERYQRVVVTLPNTHLANVVEDLEPSEKQRLSATPYLGTVCTVAVGKTPLSGHYILNLTDEQLSITGIIEMTAVVDKDQTAGHTLVYLPRYAVTDSPIFKQSDEQLAESALNDLRRVFPQADNDWLLSHKVQRARLIQPIPIAGGESHAPPREVVPGRVYCVSNAQMPPGTLNNNDCIAHATQAAASLLG